MLFETRCSLIFLAATVLACLIVFAFWLLGAVGPQTLRELRVLELEWQRRQSVLLENQTLIGNETQLPTSLQDIEMALLDVRNKIVLQDNVKLHVFSLDRPRTILSDAVAMENPSSEDVVVLRTNLELKVPHALILFELLEFFLSVSEWRPTEVKGCSMRRERSVVALSVSCTIDTYYIAFPRQKQSAGYAL